jgi:hypothetical protein
MSSGPKEARDEERYMQQAAHLERVAKLSPERLVELYETLDTALEAFRTSDLRLTRKQFTALDKVDYVRQALR